MAYQKYTYNFKNVTEYEIHYAGKYGAKGEKRARKVKPTPEQIKKQNQINKENRVRRLILANFDAGDLWITLKYPKGTRKSIEEVKDDLRKFINNLRKRYKKLDVPLKWIRRLEIGSQGAMHIHMLVNRAGPEADKLIQSLWEHGRVNYENTYDAGGYKKLANYIVKEPTEQVYEQMSMFDEKEQKQLISYSCSRNLVHPVPSVKEYSRRTVRKLIEEGPTPAEGYYIDKDSIVAGTNPYTGMSYYRYSEIKIKSEWQKGDWNEGS